jgi:hypothetical protein
MLRRTGAKALALLFNAREPFVRRVHAEPASMLMVGTAHDRHLLV